MRDPGECGRVAIPIDGLRGYLVDASGQVWRSSDVARDRRMAVTKPLVGNRLRDLSLRLGKSHSNRDKAPKELLRGVWQLRPSCEVALSTWRGNLFEYLAMSARGYESDACWYEIILPPLQHRRNRTTLSNHGSLVDSRRHFPFIVMGSLVFREIGKVNR